MPQSARTAQAAPTLLTAAQRDLVAFVAWMPARQFNADVVVATVQAWEWILSDLPHLRVPLMSEIVAAWNWTVHQHYGLFSGRNRSINKASTVSNTADTAAMHSILFRPWEAAATMYVELCGCGCGRVLPVLSF